MRTLAVILVVVCLAACTKPAPPPPPPVESAEASPEEMFIHTVEWRGQTLGEIAKWYTGDFENWQKLIRPVNPDLERCCVPLKIGREVSIPKSLLVREEPMPKPKAKPTPTPKPATKAESEKTATEPADEPEEPAAEEPKPSKILRGGEPKAEAPSEAVVGEAPAEAPLAEAPTEEAPLAEAPAAEAPAEATAPKAEKPAGSKTASGKVSFKGRSWQVADAIAYPSEDGWELALSDKPYDRGDLAKDGKVDSFDVMRHRMSTESDSLTLRIDHDGALSCIDYSLAQGGGSACNSAYAKGLELDSKGPKSLAGRFAIADSGDEVDVRFDVPVLAKIERAGKKLPAGGGEPGKAVLAHFAAVASGDMTRIMATADPDKRKLMAETPKEEAAQMLGFLQAMTPSNVTILGGVVNGDKAIVDFEGTSNGQKVKGNVDVNRVDGAWYADSVHVE